MSKTFKNFITLAFVSGLGFIGYKIFRIIKDTIELEKFLPKFFDSSIGEKPEISIALTLNQITLTAKFSKAAIEKNPDLEQSIIDYVNNYYSSFCMSKFKVVLQEKLEDPVVKNAKEETAAVAEPIEESIQPKKESDENDIISPKKRVKKPVKKKA